MYQNIIIIIMIIIDNTGHEGLVANFNFYIQPAPTLPTDIQDHHHHVDGNGIIPDRDQLWQLSGGNRERYTDDNSVVKLGFHETDVNAVGRFVWSLFL